MTYTINMSFENPKNEETKMDKSKALAIMNGLFGQMQQLGRQDWEPPAAIALIEQVMRDQITPEEGVERMQGILDSKQEH